MIEKDFNLIERFFQMDLDERELSDFKKRMDEDAAFNTKVEKYQLANKTAHELYLPGYQNILEKQKQEFKDSHAAKVKKMPTSRKWLSIAAAVSMLLIAGYFLVNTKSNSLEDLQRTALRMADNTINVDALGESGTRSNTPLEINSVLEAYKKEEFEKVIVLSEKYLQQADILLLRALALHKSGKSDEAIEHMKALISLPSGQKDAALWWLTSIHLEQGKTLEAKQFLQQIIDGKYPSASEARSILKEL